MRTWVTTRITQTSFISITANQFTKNMLPKIKYNVTEEVLTVMICPITNRNLAHTNPETRPADPTSQPTYISKAPGYRSILQFEE
jgi:hypothetical protein